jgi:hypothetical protein
MKDYQSFRISVDIISSRPPADEGLQPVNLNDLSLADDEELEINPDGGPFAQSDGG